MRLTELLYCVNFDVMPIQTGLHHIDLSDPKTVKEIKDVRAEKLKNKRKQLF